MNHDHAPWLRAMQNASIGEARSRAFLLDRFWVLERSVDIDGADFIIQRRLTTRTLLDREAPRLGVVQVKFFGTSRTTHHVHKQYVVDASGDVRQEFFLLCHVGNEEDAKMFLITAQEVHEQFALMGPPLQEKYRIPFDTVVENRRYEVINRKHALDRIERQLALADFIKNRSFLAWALPSAQDDLDAILPVYREPLNNWWGDIPAGFTKVKAAARQSMIEIAEIHDLLLKVTEEVDPVEAEELIDRIAYSCRDGFGKWRVSLDRELEDPEFFSVCREHRRRVDRLREDGLLDAFLVIPRTVCESVTASLKSIGLISPDKVIQFTVRYDVSSLAVKSVDATVASEKEVISGGRKEAAEDDDGVLDTLMEESRIMHAEPGCIRCHVCPHEQFIVDAQRVTYCDPAYPLYQECLDAIFSLKYSGC